MVYKLGKHIVRIELDLLNPKERATYDRICKAMGTNNTEPGKKIHVNGIIEAIGKKKDVIKVGGKWYFVDNKSAFNEGQQIDMQLTESVFTPK